MNHSEWCFFWWISSHQEWSKRKRVELGLHPEIQLMTGLAVDVSFTDGSWRILGITLKPLKNMCHVMFLVFLFSVLTKKAFPHVPVQKHFISISMASALCQRICPVLAEKKWHIHHPWTNLPSRSQNLPGRGGGKGELGGRIPSNGHWYSEVSYLSNLYFIL